MEQDSVIPTEQGNIGEVANMSSYLTTLASVATIIDVTVNALKTIDGDGVELIKSDSTSMSSEELHDTVSSFVYRAINDHTVSHEAIQGSID